jgi:hypothetical protein
VTILADNVPGISNDQKKIAVTIIVSHEGKKVNEINSLS